MKPTFFWLSHTEHRMGVKGIIDSNVSSFHNKCVLHPLVVATLTPKSEMSQRAFNTFYQWGPIRVNGGKGGRCLCHLIKHSPTHPWTHHHCRRLEVFPEAAFAQECFYIIYRDAADWEGDLILPLRSVRVRILCNTKKPWIPPVYNNVAYCKNTTMHITQCVLQS